MNKQDGLLSGVAEEDVELLQKNSREFWDDVNRIGRGAFQGLKNLTSITIPEGVMWIGIDAFRDCSNLEEVNIPKSVQSYGNCAFCGCEKLCTITVSEEVKFLGSNVFSDTGISNGDGEIVVGYDGEKFAVPYDAFYCISDENGQIGERELEMIGAIAQMDGRKVYPKSTNNFEK